MLRVVQEHIISKSSTSGRRQFIPPYAIHGDQIEGEHSFAHFSNHLNVSSFDPAKHTHRSRCVNFVLRWNCFFTLDMAGVCMKRDSSDWDKATRYLLINLK